MTDPRYPIGRFTPPATYTSAERSQFTQEMAAVPAALRAAVHGLNPSQLLTPYREGGWTVAQVVHHLADSHVNSYVRFKLTLTEEQPAVKTYDEGLWALTPDATGADIGASLGFFDGLHHRLVALLRGMTPDQFERTFLHPKQGPITLDRNLALYAWHGRHHVAHITALRERRGW